ncbi:unnamed protein product [Lactuca virosa]|nr:unnamed protein product [Lactuca virosa]
MASEAMDLGNYMSETNTWLYDFVMWDFASGNRSKHGSRLKKHRKKNILQNISNRCSGNFHDLFLDFVYL